MGSLTNDGFEPIKLTESQTELLIAIKLTFSIVKSLEVTFCEFWHEIGF